MAVGSKDLSIDKLAELSNEELAAKLSEAKKELFNIRFQEVTGQANAGRRRTIKRDIARIYTCCVSASSVFVPQLKVSPSE